MKEIIIDCAGITEKEALETIDEAMLYNELMWERVLAYILDENNCTIYYS